METTASFKFLSVEDYGNASCPHCGAEGRYIYTWEVDGKKYGAMAGCYKRLTGHIEKGEDEHYFELIAEKQAKGAKLNGWDKSVLRLLSFKSEGKYPADWCDRKIKEVMKERKMYLAKMHY